ncbi:MAG: A24 family peptidase [bacterium]|nr:A24 family peptidase [bacterium]
MFSDTPLALPLFIVALIGLLVGGVINVLADDLPRRRPLRSPRYPDGEPRPLIAWLGLTAFLTGKRASPNGIRLKWRHPLTEVGTALLMMLAVISLADDPLMEPVQFAFWLYYLAVFMLITVIDLEHRLILFVVIIPSYMVALLDPVVTTYGVTLGESLLGAALGFAVFFGLYIGGFLFTAVMAAVQRREINEVAFGYGDVMLITLSGLILGWQSLIFAMFITVFIGALGAVVYLIVRNFSRGGYTMFTPLPYGQYIVIATVIMLLYANEVALALRGY